MRPRIFLAALWILTVSSCASNLPKQTHDMPAEDLWQARNARMADLNWTLQGRVAVKNDQESWQAHLSWQQNDGRFEISFQSFFGQLLARLVGDDDGVNLYLPNKHVISSHDPTLLLHEQLGWAVPITGLQNWVTGTPADDAFIDKTVDEKGRLIHLDQQGWMIDFSRYAATQGIEMPKKIILKRDGITIRLVVDHWELRQTNG